MNALKRRSRGPRGAGALGLCAAGAAVLWLSCRDADAAAIHRHGAEPSSAHFPSMTKAELSVFRQWSTYLLAGPSTWGQVEHPPWTEAVRKAAWESIKTDPGPTDPMVNYLLWKRAIDPHRFAHAHSRLAPALHRIAMSRSSSQPASLPTTGSHSSWGSTTSPPTTALAQATSQDNLAAPNVPEPSTLLLAVGMTAWFARRMRR